jgi:glycosyltransferase involved in cell wall biosynthesis
MELARALRRMGDEVTVITGFPDYPSGRLYDGYKLGLVRREEIDGVRVIRTFEYPYHGTWAIGRFVNYLSFMLTAPLGCFFAQTFDVIYVWHPPLTIGISAWLIGRLRSVPFVYDVQDIWPEAAVLSGVLKPGFLVNCLSALERFVYNRADFILTVTDGARANLISKGVPPGKVSAMPHWYSNANIRTDEEQGRETLRAKYGWDGKFIALFAGNIGLVQGLETIVRAAELLRNDLAIQVVFVGDGADKFRLVDLVRSLSLEYRVQFIERQPMERIPAFMAAADTLLVHLRWSELSDYVIPTKTLAYLASGKPIVMAMRGAAADLVCEAGSGCTVAPEDPAAMAAAILGFSKLSANDREAMGQRGRAYLLQHFAEDVVFPRYRAVLERVVAGISQ